MYKEISITGRLEALESKFTTVHWNGHVALLASKIDIVNLYKKLHNFEVAVNTMAEANKEVKLSSSEEEVSYNTEQWFNKPKNGSVIPVKRKSVMKMIITSVLANKSAPPPTDTVQQGRLLIPEGYRVRLYSISIFIAKPTTSP